MHCFEVKIDRKLSNTSFNLSNCKLLVWLSLRVYDPGPGLVDFGIKLDMLAPPIPYFGPFPSIGGILYLMKKANKLINRLLLLPNLQIYHYYPGPGAIVF